MARQCLAGKEIWRETVGGQEVSAKEVEVEIAFTMVFYRSILDSAYLHAES